MMNIPLLKPFFGSKIKIFYSLFSIMKSGEIAYGKYVEMFEKKFQYMFNTKCCLAMSSATAAIHSALVVSDLKFPDEVITTPMTAEATNLAILHSGLKIVWADICKKTGNICAESIKDNITKNTKAIIAVHYAGYPCDMEKIWSIAKKNNLIVIEDSAQAMGSKFNGKYPGEESMSDFVVYSFQATKHITTTDGGIIIAKNEEKHRRLKNIRWFGLDRDLKFLNRDIKEVGFKYNMNNFIACIGYNQLKYLSNIVEKYRENANFYKNELNNVPGLEFLEECDSEPSYWIFGILVEKRDLLEKKLNSLGIQSSIAHKRNDLHSVFYKYKKDLPNLDWFYEKILFLPCGWWLNNKNRKYIVNAIKNGW